MKRTTYGLGAAHRRAFRIWAGMLQRCRNKNLKAFRWYGGRGIKVCERWQVFDNFVADMGDPPDGMSLDRRDNDRDYEPGNCRWATPLTQGRNSRWNLRITHNGVTRCASEWSELLGIKPSTIVARWRLGLRSADLLEVGDRRALPITHDGVTRNVTEWSKMTGLSKRLINSRWAQGIRPPKLFAPVDLRLPRDGRALKAG